MSIRNRDSVGERIFDFCNIAIMCLLSMVFVYPVFNILAISLSSSAPILRGEVSFFPIQFTTMGFDTVLDNKYIWLAYRNTIFVAGVGTIIGVIMTCFAAYPLAFGDFYGKKIYTWMILFTMWFGGGLVPTFLVMQQLGLLNTHWALILNFLTPAFYVVILKSFFASIHKSLIESAKIDGANDIYCMFKIVLPLSKPVLATISLWYIVGHWNSFLIPLIFLTDRTKFTLQIVLRDIVLQATGAMYGLTALTHAGDGIMVIPQQVTHAVIFVAMVPMLIIYPFLQKYFVKGIMIGSIKG